MMTTLEIRIIYIKFIAPNLDGPNLNFIPEVDN